MLSGQEYSWKSSEKVTGLWMDGRLIVTPRKKGTNPTAILTYEVPKAFSPLIRIAGIEKVLKDSMDKALENIGKMAKIKHKTGRS
jgi:hypothetical protein